MMWIILITAIYLMYLVFVVGVSYRLGTYKTENATKAAMLGFVLSFLPPLALIYLIVLFLKEDVAIV
ncbi:hypothetical protein [Thalassotalea hakodatensis]|uniref:hypothetical protein n=1 Tax=Thalassotalea hakodatensis TaxID=3030492 RepID=UPI002573529F|nr:hypothetical protein [Thalassotalea hakodatensis]